MHTSHSISGDESTSSHQDRIGDSRRLLSICVGSSPAGSQRHGPDVVYVQSGGLKHSHEMSKPRPHVGEQPTQLRPSTIASRSSRFLLSYVYRVWQIDVFFTVLLQSIAGNDLKSLLDIDCFLCRRLKVGDTAFCLTPSYSSLLGNHT